MCGITGILNFNNKEKVDKNIIKRMNDKIKHRGPDSEGFYIKGNIGLGNRRLSILDLKTGDQPIYNEDKSVVIVYNGEIYNYKEIRKELEEKGHKFKTNTDTETIVHAYEEYGKKCVKLFNGMFGFALYDKKKRLLFLGRDRLGIKPLYYYYDKKKIIFSSEIKAILEAGVTRELNKYGLADFLMFQNILDEKTFFKDIYKLLPGQLIIAKGGKIRIERYWDVRFDIKKDENKNYTQEYRRLLKLSVKKHLMSDVPLGCYLSGGFDSTSVATFANKLVGGKISTFSGIYNEGKKYSELSCIKAVIKKINPKAHKIFINPEDFIDNIEDIVYHLDEPITGTGSFSHYMVSRLVSKHVRVVLTGHGGDELFAGYQAFKALYYKKIIKENPLNIFKFFRGMKLSELSRVAYYLFYPIFIDHAVKYGIFIMFSKKEQKKLFTKEFYKKLGAYDPLGTVEKILKGKRFNSLDRAQYLYLKTYLPALFILEDKVGMAHSIEARTPICGNDVVDFALTIPIAKKLQDGNLKSIPRKAMKGILPGLLYKQPKKGFPTPLAKWFRGPLKKFTYEIMLSDKAKKRNIFNMNYIKKLLDKNTASISDNLYDYVRANKIFSLLIIELWFRIFIDDKHA